MEIRRVGAAEGPIRRYVEELWLPYMRELEEVVEREGLSPEFDLEAEIEWQTDRFDAANSRLWVALGDAEEPTAPLGAVEATFAGFVGAELEPASSSFDRPDSVVVGDFYKDSRQSASGLDLEGECCKLH